MYASTGSFADPPHGLRAVESGIARVRRSLHGLRAKVGDDTDEFLAKMTRIALHDIPGADHVGVTLVEHPSKVRSLSATSPHPLILDSLQQRCGCGPNFELGHDHPTCRVDDLAADTRWPEFTRLASACGPTRAMLSFHLFSIREVTGVLTVYANRPNGFPAGAARIGMVFVPPTVLALGSKSDTNELFSPLFAEDPIAAARQVLMRRYEIDEGSAFALLVRLAEGSDHTVATVARRIVDNQSDA